MSQSINLAAVKTWTRTWANSKKCFHQQKKGVMKYIFSASSTHLDTYFPSISCCLLGCGLWAVYSSKVKVFCCWVYKLLEFMWTWAKLLRFGTVMNVAYVSLSQSKPPKGLCWSFACSRHDRLFLVSATWVSCIVLKEDAQWTQVTANQIFEFIFQ